MNEELEYNENQAEIDLETYLLLKFDYEATALDNEEFIREEK